MTTFTLSGLKATAAAETPQTRGLFRQFLLGPDFIGGKGDQVYLSPALRTMIEDSNQWKVTFEKIGGYYFRFGLLNQIFDSNCAIKTQYKDLISIDNLKVLTARLNASSIPVTIETGGVRLHSFHKREDLKKGAAGITSAVYDYNRLKCWLNVGGKIDAVVMDNPVAIAINMQTGYGYTQKISLLEPLNQSDLISETANYMIKLDQLIPNVKFGWTEYLGVTKIISVDKTFPSDIAMENAYRNHFVGLQLNYELGFLLDTLNEKLSNLGTSIRLTSYYIDYDLFKVELDRERYQARPMERILEAEKLLMNRKIHVGIFLAQWEETRTACYFEAKSYKYCADYLIEFHAPAYPGLTSEEVKTKYEAEARSRTFRYLKEYFSNGGQGRLLTYSPWQTWPETILPENTPGAMMNTAVNLGTTILPKTLAKGTVFRLPGTAVAVILGDDSTCIFASSAQLKKYATSRNINTKKLQRFGNPPALQVYRGKCEDSML